MVDFAIPWDANVAKKEKEKIDNYRDLATQVGRMNGVKVEIVPLVVGAVVVGWGGLEELGEVVEAI